MFSVACSLRLIHAKHCVYDGALLYSGGKGQAPKYPATGSILVLIWSVLFRYAEYIALAVIGAIFSFLRRITAIRTN